LWRLRGGAHLERRRPRLLTPGLPDAGDVMSAATVTPLLNAEQAAALLNVPKSWVLAEARANRIPHVRLGRYVRFDADELERWWCARTRGPKHEA
jgi:excisionase family DNA binding protein